MSVSKKVRVEEKDVSCCHRRSVPDGRKKAVAMMSAPTERTAIKKKQGSRFDFNGK